MSNVSKFIANQKKQQQQQTNTTINKLTNTNMNSRDNKIDYNMSCEHYVDGV